jgi:hypothetical protein
MISDLTIYATRTSPMLRQSMVLLCLQDSPNDTALVSPKSSVSPQYYESTHDAQSVLELYSDNKPDQEAELEDGWSG